MKIAKTQRRQFRRGVRRFRDRVAEASPAWLRRAAGPVVDTLDMLLIDHGIFRMAYLNRHEIAPGAWRAAQPAPRDLRRAAREGIRTIVNLRGVRDCGAYRLEVKTCAATGLKLVDFPVKSRATPEPEVILAAAKLFSEIEYPILMHCKSGADRAGLMSTLYMILKERRPVAESLKQLDWRYGHFRQANTGILDHVFESYLKDNPSGEEPFETWVATRYDPEAVRASFRAKGWANFIVNRVLWRE
ncbi:MAG: sulfur transferase domain-containing protein [Hyphomicrobiaceae bacterium]